MPRFLSLATLKTELVQRSTFKSRDAARLAIFEYIEAFYNPLRRHSTLGYKSPMEFEQIHSEETKEAAAAQALTCPRKPDAPVWSSIENPTLSNPRFTPPRGT